VQPAKIQWSADPEERQAQINTEITRRRQQQFQGEHPFAPPNILPQTREDIPQIALSDITRNRLPRQGQGHKDEFWQDDPKYSALAEEQFHYQQQQGREKEIAQRRAQIEQQKGSNATREATMRGAGQQFYTDPYGNLQPVIETGTNRPLYHATPWELANHPQTGEPVLTMRDRYGQQQFKAPKIVPSLDPTDDNMYYQHPDGTLSEQPAGTIKDLAQHPNYQIAKAALAANKRNITAKHQGILDAAAIARDEANANLSDAQSEIKDLTDKISEQTEKAGNAQGVDGKDTPLSIGIQSAVDQMTKRRDDLLKSTKKGDLFFDAQRQQHSYIEKAATARHDAYAAQADEIKAAVAARGGNYLTDPTYLANQNAMGVLDDVKQKATASLQRIDAVSGRLSDTGVGSTRQPLASNAPTDDPLQQSEPYVAAARGDKSVGGVGIDEFARRYGDGRGPVQPASVLKLKQRSDEIASILNPETHVTPGLPNSVTTLNTTAQEKLTDEKNYLDQLALQRTARLPQDQQQRIIDATRDPTFWEKLKDVTGQAVGGFNAGVIDTGAGVARSLTLPGTLGEPARAAIDKSADFLRIKLVPTATSASDVPEVQQKLSESNAHTLAATAGGMAAMVAPGAALGRVGKIAGLSDHAASLLGQFGSTVAGSAQSGEGLRREAIDKLAPELQAGKITHDEYEKSVGLATIAGVAIGAVGFASFPQFASRIAGLPTGKTLLDGMLSRAARGGATGVTKWLAGEGGKLIPTMLREGVQAGGIGFSQTLANDLAAKEVFDPSRKIDAANASKTAAQMGIIGALASALSHVRLPAPKTTPEPPTESAPPPETPPDAPVEPAPFTPRGEPPSAAEAAKTLAPEIKEKEHTPPPTKSAAESAQVFAQTPPDAATLDRVQALADKVATGTPEEQAGAQAEFEQMVGAKQPAESTPSETAPKTESLSANEPISAQQTDAARYQEVQNQIRALTSPEKVNSQEMQNLLAEYEAIKNRNGGMPPGETTTMAPRTIAEVRSKRAALAGNEPEPITPAEAPTPEVSTLGDQPVKMEVRRARTGETVEVEIPARKAEKRVNDHMAVLRKVIDCLGGAT
jgi:hypothetical protein